MDFTDTIKNILLAGIGAAAVTAEKSKEIVGDLVKKGELTVEEGKSLNEELKRKAGEKAGSRVMDSVDKMTREERDALRAKLDELDK